MRVERSPHFLGAIVKQKLACTPAVQLSFPVYRPPRKGIRKTNAVHGIYGKYVLSTQVLEMSLLGLGTVLRLGRGAS